MATYGEAMQADAYHGYNPHQSSIHVDREIDRADQGYMPGDSRMDNNEYLPSNGYYAPPQAPRLTAAAARASSMAAMYYNPTLHPLHPLSSHVGGIDPWAPPVYIAREYGHNFHPAPSYDHQQIEQQLLTQNRRGLGNQAGYSAATSAYGQEHHQPEQAAHRYSYPNDRSQPSWNHSTHSSLAWGWNEGTYGQALAAYQRNLSDATPTGHASNHRGNSYFNYAKPSINTVAPGHHSHSQSLSLPPQAHLQDRPGGWNNGPEPDDTWNGRNNEWGPVHASKGYQGAWQGAPGWGQVNDNVSWNQIDRAGTASGENDAWMQQQAPYHPGLSLHHNQAAIAPTVPYFPDAYGDARAGLATVEPVERINDNTAREANNEQAPADNTKSAPAPPSPGTLDKSSVPISSVGAEIIWSACAVFSDPSLLAICTQSQRKDGRGRTFTRSSSMSSTPYTPSLAEADWSMSPVQLSTSHQRNKHGGSKSQILASGGEAAANSEESSASSSEPGTPPSSFPSYMYEDAFGPDSKHKLPRTMQESRGLSLSSGADIRFGASRQVTGSRDHSMPPLNRQTAQDGVQVAISSVLNLVSLNTKWSNHDDKLPSLSHSLRDGASNDNFPTFQGHNIASQNMRPSHSRGISPRSEERPTANGSASHANESSPAFKRFAHQVLAQTLVSPTAFMLAMMYSLRVTHLAIKTNEEGVAELDAEAGEIFAQPISAAPFKLFTLGLMIANKHLDDNTFLNKTWNEVTGISLTEINRMERWYLEKCSYEIAVPEEPWVAFLEKLAIRTEVRLASCNEAPRHRHSAKVRSASSNAVKSATSLKTLGGLTHEEALKRMLLSIEEALVVLGRLAPFDLSRQMTNDSPRFGQDQRRFGSASPDSFMNICEGSESGNSIQSLHHDCRSAPSLALHHDDPQDTDFDVFGDEIGPYRPQGQGVRSSMGNNHRFLDPSLNRSISENTASLTWKQQQQQSRQYSDSHRKVLDRSAPLAPSVLLDLLNRGQQFVH